MDPQTAAIIQALHDTQQAQHTQNHELLQQLIAVQNQMLTQAQVNKASPISMVDNRGIGKPGNFKGEETKHQEWKVMLNAYLRVSNP